MEAREGSAVGVVARPPRLGQRAGEVVLLGQQVGSPVPHPPGLDQQHLGVGRQQVGEQALLRGEPREPRLHPVEDETLAQALPLLAAPRLIAHQGGGPLPHVGRGQ